MHPDIKCSGKRRGCHLNFIVLSLMCHFRLCSWDYGMTFCDLFRSSVFHWSPIYLAFIHQTCMHNWNGSLWPLRCHHLECSVVSLIIWFSQMSDSIFDRKYWLSINRAIIKLSLCWGTKWLKKNVCHHVRWQKECLQQGAICHKFMKNGWQQWMPIVSLRLFHCNSMTDDGRLDSALKASVHISGRSHNHWCISAKSLWQSFPDNMA